MTGGFHHVYQIPLQITKTLGNTPEFSVELYIEPGIDIIQMSAADS